MSNAFLLGVALDLALGDPRWLPHPIRALGWTASRLESAWRSTGLPLRVAGFLFWMCVVTIATVVVWITLPWLNAYWIWMFLALRSLDIESWSVLGRLQADDIAGARSQLGMIVGRDTAHLEEHEILRGLVETVSENLNDAVIAPLFYLALGGPVLMAAYKAVNTLDSMVGYKNDRYREFGWFSARMDDFANYLPARLSAALVWICAFLPRFDAGRSIAVTLRDGRSQPSPNSGYPEAAFAGALGIQLGGMNYYGGVASAKAYLGNAERPLTRDSVRDARILLYGSSALMIGAVWAVLRWL